MDLSAGARVGIYFVGNFDDMCLDAEVEKREGKRSRLTPKMWLSRYVDYQDF